MIWSHLSWVQYKLYTVLLSNFIGDGWFYEIIIIFVYSFNGIVVDCNWINLIKCLEIIDGGTYWQGKIIFSVLFGGRFNDDDNLIRFWIELIGTNVKTKLFFQNYIHQVGNSIEKFYVNKKFLVERKPIMLIFSTYCSFFVEPIILLKQF